MDEALCREHLDKARRQLEQTDVDVLYITSISNHLYFTGIPLGPGDRPVALLITRDGEPPLVAPGFEGPRIRETRLIGDVVTWEEHENPFALVADVLKKRGLASGRIALDGQTWLWVADGLRAALPNATFVNGEELTKNCRMTKNERELGLIEHACQITGSVLASAIAELKEGTAEADFEKRIAQKYRAAGVEGGSLVQSGLTASDPHKPAGERRISRGDAVVLDSGCQYNHFCSDVTRTLMVGEIPEDVRKAWTTLKDAQQAALDTIRPGATCESIDAAARDWLTERGYGEYFLHRLGHGIGVDGHEYPYLVKGNTMPLEPGMTTTVEPGIYVPGKWGMRIEDVMVVTDDGYRLLSHMIPRDFEI